MDQEQLKKWIAIGSLLLAGVGGVFVTNKGQIPGITPAPEVAPTPQLEGNPEGITVDVPENIKVGELVVLDTAGSDSDNFAWRVIPHTENFMVIDERKRAVFSSGKPGEYIFIVSALIDGKVETAAYIATVGGAPAPFPQPDDPSPTPGPSPSSGLAGQVTSWLQQMQANPSECRALRRSFNSVLLGMQSGVLKEAEDIVAAQKTATALAFRTNAPRWAGFKEQLRQNLNALRDQGRLETTNDHMMVWSEIIAGITAHLGD